MAGRTGKLTEGERHQIGRAVLSARRNRVPWKVLERVYDRDRTQLWRYARRAMARNQDLGGEAGEVMQHLGGRMQHLGSCCSGAISANVEA